MLYIDHGISTPQHTGRHVLEVDAPQPDFPVEPFEQRLRARVLATPRGAERLWSAFESHNQARNAAGGEKLAGPLSCTQSSCISLFSCTTVAFLFSFSDTHVLSAPDFRKVLRECNCDIPLDDFDELIRKYGKEVRSYSTSGDIRVDYRRLMESVLGYPKSQSRGSGGRVPPELSLVREKIRRAANRYGGEGVRESLNVNPYQQPWDLRTQGQVDLMAVFRGRDFSQRGTLPWDEFLDGLTSLGLDVRRNR